MNIRPIHNEADYDWALAEIAPYFDAEPQAGTPDADRFDILAALIAAYEAQNWPVAASDPVSAILYCMEIKNKTQKDLAHLLGSKSRASEILNKHRALTLPMIHKLSAEWGIPAELLIPPYPLIKVA